MSKKTEILITTLETGETVLAKKERVEDAFDGTAQFQELPLRYDNETQALTKIASIRPAPVEMGHRAKVIKQGGRFLVFVFDAEPGIRGEPTDEQVQTALRSELGLETDYPCAQSH